MQADCDFLKFKILFRIQKIRVCSLRRIIQFGASWDCYFFKTFKWEFSRSAQSGSKDSVKIWAGHVCFVVIGIQMIRIKAQLITFHVFCTCKFTYSLQCVCNSQINTHWCFPGHGHGKKKLTVLTLKFLAEVAQGDILPSCFSSDTVNKCTFHGPFSEIFLTFLCFLMVISLLKIPPSIVLKLCLVFLLAKISAMCLREKIRVRLRFVQAGVTVLLAMNSILMKQQYILNKVSLNRNTYGNKVMYCSIDKKYCGQRLRI